MMHWVLFAGLLGVASAEKPNVLFVACDDMNDWVGECLGDPETDLAGEKVETYEKWAKRVGAVEWSQLEGRKE